MVKYIAIAVVFFATLSAVVSIYWASNSIWAESEALPSAWYQTGGRDLMYDPPIGPEFRLSAEALAMKAYYDDEALDLRP